MSVLGKHIVISGGGSGVGATLARVFCKDSANVTILGRRFEPLRSVASETGALPITCDITDRHALEQALKQAREKYGPISVSVANAGQSLSAPFQRLSPEDFSESLAVNLMGVFHLWQTTQADMIGTGWGRLLAIASTAGLKGYPYVSHYCAAKHGVIGLTRSLAHEFGKTNITVNAICPGFTDTPLLSHAINTIIDKTGMTADEAAKTLLAGNPQKRFITTTEVAETALWLCSDAAAAINGHALTLSGGEI